ncbi:uncharacterized protein BJ171DRAFT_626486 [Polychytrium aggregatum]|uniref:uncharacterized protein n=1 Tax=Polychytrium aggregatum TaxID=110093 RepID=UPI0022FDF74E|nr:uncharacterized protein BJ171DRAFT_626486 [Polychytrium aggregatum]KAI9202742.1 hypothetical protein BJ171DRAFT_626486 [Polychytrium aggregatum]
MSTRETEPNTGHLAALERAKLRVYSRRKNPESPLNFSVTGDARNAIANAAEPSSNGTLASSPMLAELLQHRSADPTPPIVNALAGSLGSPRYRRQSMRDAGAYTRRRSRIPESSSAHASQEEHIRNDTNIEGETSSGYTRRLSRRSTKDKTEQKDKTGSDAVPDNIVPKESEDIREAGADGGSVKERLSEGRPSSSKARKRSLFKRKDSDRPSVPPEPPSYEDEYEVNALQLAAQKRQISTYVSLEKWVPCWTKIAESEKQLLVDPETFTTPTTESWMSLQESIYFIEEEGFFVPETPYFPPRNLRKLEFRLRMTEPNYGSKWFGPDQKLCFQPIPWRVDRPRRYVRDVPFTPVTRKYGDFFEELEFCEPGSAPQIKAIDATHIERRSAVRSMSFKPVLDNPTGSYVMIIDLVDISLNEHPLMTEEMRLAIEIESWVRLLRSRKRNGIVTFLTRKLESLREQMREHPYFEFSEDPIGELSGQSKAEGQPQSRQKLHSYEIRAMREKHERQENAYLKLLENIRATRLLRDTEAQTDRLLEFKILQKWEQMKHIRGQSGFTTSSLKVSVKCKPRSPEEDKAGWKREIEDELYELAEEYKIKKWRHKRLVADEETRRAERHPSVHETEPESPSSDSDNGSRDQEGDGAENPIDDDDDNEEHQERREKRREIRSRSLSRYSRSSRRRVSDEDIATSVEQVSKPREQHKKSRKKSRSKSNQSASRETDVLNWDSTTQLSSKSRKIGNSIESDIGKDEGKARIKKSPFRHGREDLRSEDILSGIPPLPKFELKDEKERIKQRLKSSHRPIGAPSLVIMAMHTEPVSEPSSCPKDEQLRRREVESSHVYACIRYNDKEVTRTKPQFINPTTFKVPFLGLEDESKNHKAWSSQFKEASFAVQVNEVPEKISVQLYEMGVMGDRLLGEVFVPIPEPAENASALDREPQQLQFTGTSMIRSRNLMTLDEGQLFEQGHISGTIRMSVAWGFDEKGNSLGPTVKLKGEDLSKALTVDPLSKGGIHGTINVRSIMKWISDLSMDPNDPRNSHILQLKQLLTASTSGTELGGQTFHEYWSSKRFMRFRIPRMFADAAFGVGLEYNGRPVSNRLELLTKRFDKKITFHGPVPLYDEQIEPSNYENVVDSFRSLVEDEQTENTKRGEFNSQGELIRPQFRSKFMKRIRAHQLFHNARVNRPKRVEDFVREERLTEADPQAVFTLQFLKPFRPLKPKRLDRISMAVSQPETCKILAHVIRGFNLPIRNANSNIVDAAAPVDDSKPTFVRPYVEISFLQERVRTSTGDGPFPHWNETLVLNVKPTDGDFRPESLLESELGTSIVFINVFDEYIVDLLEDDRDRDRNIHQRKERNWLGSLQIPFTTIHERIRMEGYFALQLPPILLGYDKIAGTNVDDAVYINVDSGNQASLHLFITLDPPLMQPSTLNLVFKSREEPHHLRAFRKWETSLKYPARNVKATCLDMNGYITLITRFIRPQNPPGSCTTVAHAARYVSLIPFLPNRTALAADCSLWSTSDQVLDVGAGDGIEHAILLCNYLLHLGKNAFVLLGDGRLETRVAFVLIVEGLKIPKVAASGSRAGSDSSLQQARPRLSIWNGRPKGEKDAKADVVVSEDSKDAQATSDPQPAEGPKEEAKEESAAEVSYKIVNPGTGQWHAPIDPHNPVVVVKCVFNSDNIWANEQEYEDPQRINWNITDQSLWRPLLTRGFPPINMESIQKEELVYKRSSKTTLRILEEEIERCVVQKIEEWRKHRLTRWNRLCARVFKSILVTFEDSLLEGHMMAAEADFERELAALHAVYQIVGFPLHMTLTDMDAVLEAVYATDVHSNFDETAEFSVSVHCVGYDGVFVSIWIYLVGLTRTRR